MCNLQVKIKSSLNCHYPKQSYKCKKKLKEIQASFLRIQYDLAFFQPKWKRDADAEAEFQLKHCGTALVNKHWDEEDQWHCSPFNTAPEQEKNSRYSLRPLSPPALAHENTIDNSSPWQQTLYGVEMYIVHPFFFTFPRTVVSLRRKGTPKKTKGSLQSHMLCFMGLSLAITLCQTDN